MEPFLKWEHIFERIQEFLGYLTTDERELTWFEVEKWSPDGTGRLKNDYVYTNVIKFDLLSDSLIGGLTNI